MSDRSPKILRALWGDERGVTVHVAATPDAVDLYNRLTGTDAVGGLFHSTC